MAAKSATSSTKSARSLKTFITFRVAGDNLVPDEVTKLLKMRPTHARLKGKPYSTGKSKDIIPSTNIWFLSTDTVIASDSIIDHIRLVLFILGLMESSGDLLDAPVDRHTSLSRMVSLKLLLRSSSSKATMTLFWHGTSGSSAPKVPQGLLDILKLVEVDVEVDFDKDEDDVGTSARRRSRAA